MLDLEMLRGTNDFSESKWPLVERVVSYIKWLGSEPGAMNDTGYTVMRWEALTALERELKEAGVLYDRNDITIKSKKRPGRSGA